MLAGPVERGRQAGAAIEVAGLTAALLPVADGADEVESQGPTRGVLVKPPLEAWPLPQQRLVGDLDEAVTAGQQARVGEGVEDLGDRRIAVGVELGEGDAAADELGALARPREAQQDGPGDRLAVRVQLGVGGFGQAGDGTTQAAAGPVCGQRQAAVFAGLPQLEQGGRQERQDARLGAGVGHERLGQPRLDPQPDPLRGMLDDGRQLEGAQRSDQHLVGADQTGQGRIGGAPSVVIGPDRDDDLQAGALAREQVDERASLGVVAGRIEDLLELIDHDDEPVAGRERGEGGIERGRRIVARQRSVRHGSGERSPELGERMLAGSQDGLGPALAAGQDAAGQGRQQPGPERR